MKITQLELSGFRGIRDPANIWFPSGFAIIVGRNGAGKSTVCDAIEFALTGTITRHRSGTEKGESIEQYLWWRGADSPPKCYVSLTLADESGREYVITRRPDGKEPDGWESLNLCYADKQSIRQRDSPMSVPRLSFEMN